MKIKLKNLKSKIPNIKRELKKYQDLAKNYLDIIRKIDQRTSKKGILDFPEFMTVDKLKLSQEEFEFIEANSYIIQEHCNKFGLGYGSYRRPFGLGDYPYYEFILNFPILYKSSVTRDEAIALISIIKSSLSTFIQKVEELLNDEKKLKKFIKISNEQKVNWGLRMKLNKAKIIEMIFLGLYIYSLSILVKPETFVIGIGVNIISVIFIIIISFIGEEKRKY